ncbi:uncharacterized protein PFL1_04819 [Pseudozyma flocculosa PF-1]|uniref:CWF21 domain-containing protein n=1 Tax=Pseudozyma flocculosa PF-1 TaxID=1277687 RepID=A0A061HAQ2_9BASI|nr:uncharacterized protein PFL1_04819 [Pseudozyma flocculosa PF-1]EPQ27681.1 hypothetical protein PFL1_04819 [Pseudozyma flocculosa PF-1]
MYNGIGLKSARGSGTNGYIQRNLSNLKPRDDWRKDRGATDFKDDVGGRARHVQPDAGILDHERKRKVEVRCMELQDELEEEGLPADEVEEQVAALRRTLQDALANPASSFGAATHAETKSLRPSDTHALRMAKTIEEAKMQRALGIDAEYKEGDAFDRELQERKKLQRIEERRQADEARRRDWERKKQLNQERRALTATRTTMTTTMTADARLDVEAGAPRALVRARTTRGTRAASAAAAAALPALDAIAADRPRHPDRLRLRRLVHRLLGHLCCSRGDVAAAASAAAGAVVSTRSVVVDP